MVCRFEQDTSEPSSKELHIDIDFTKGSTFDYMDIRACKVHDTENKRWQHLNFFEHKCYLHARVPRVKLPNGKVRTIQVPWGRSSSGFTLMFEAYAMLLIENEMPVSKTSKTVRATAPRLWRVFDYRLEKAIYEDDISSVCELGIDETSSKKGHEYITLFVDLEQRRVIDTQIGKDKSCIKKFVHTLEAKGRNRKQVEQVSIDMSPSFIEGTLEMLPNAQLTFDKFHLVQHRNKAMDETHKAERTGNDLLKGHKYTFLKNSSKLSRTKENQLNNILLHYPVLGEAYRLKEMFKDVFDIADPEEAKGYLGFGCEMASESRI